MFDIEQFRSAAGGAASRLPGCTVESPDVPEVARAAEADVDRTQRGIRPIDGNVRN